MKHKDHGIDVIDHMYELATPIRNGYTKMCAIDGQEFCDFVELYETQLHELSGLYDQYVALFGLGGPISLDDLLGEQCIEDLLYMTEGGWDGHHNSPKYGDTYSCPWDLEHEYAAIFDDALTAEELKAIEDTELPFPL